MEWLKNSGIRTHKGNVFSFGRVSEMLRNKKYIGEFYYNGELYEDTEELRLSKIHYDEKLVTELAKALARYFKEHFDKIGEE